MKNLMFLIILCLFVPVANSSVIPEKYFKHCNFPFSNDQINLLNLASKVGADSDLSYTLQGITTKESFIWVSVVRHRIVSKRDTSFGATHLRPSTAVWLLTDQVDVGHPSLFKMAIRFILQTKYGDALSLNLTLRYLVYKMNHQGKSWTRAIGEYNAGWRWNTAGVPYTNGVKTNIRYYQKCWKHISKDLK